MHIQPFFCFQPRALPLPPPRNQDCSDEWQDLDDLLEATLDGESPISTNKTSSGAAAGARVAAGSRGSPEDEALIDGKLSELDALLKSETDAVRGGNRASAAVRFEQAGAEAKKVMEAFLGERGQGGDEEPDNSARRDHLGHEEERLLEMVGFLFGTEALPALDAACLIVPMRACPRNAYIGCGSFRDEGLASFFV